MYESFVIGSSLRDRRWCLGRENESANENDFNVIGAGEGTRNGHAVEAVAGEGEVRGRGRGNVCT